MTIEYGLQSKITSVDTILLVHPSRYYMIGMDIECIGPLVEGVDHDYEKDKRHIAILTALFEKTKKNFEGLEQRFDSTKIHSLVNHYPSILEFGNVIRADENSRRYLPKSDSINLLNQGIRVMLGGGRWIDCHAFVFNELVLDFLYSEAASENKLRILAPANYIYNAASTIDEVLKREGKEEFLKVFRDDYLQGHYLQSDFQKKIAPFSHSLLFDGEVIVEHKTNSKKEFSLEVLSSI